MKFCDDALKRFTNSICNVDKFNENIINCKDWNSITLNNGCVGIILFLLEAKEYVDNNKWENAIRYYLKMFLSVFKYEDKYIKLDASILNGLSGIGIMLKNLKDEGVNVDELLNEVNERILVRASIKLESSIKNISERNVEQNDYDVIVGMSSIFRYCLYFEQDPRFKKLIRNIVEYFLLLLEETEYKNKLIPNYYIKYENVHESTAQYYPNGLFDYGVSHGISGILSVLSIARLQKVNIDGQEYLIKKILDILKKKLVTKNDLIYWPATIGFNEYCKNDNKYENFGLFSWCYGIPGTARAIYLGAKSVGDKYMENIAIKSFEYMAKKNSEIKFDNCILCHGYSSLLLSLSLMYNDTNNHIFNKACDTLIKKYEKEYNEANMYGFNGEVLEYNSKKISEECISVLNGNLGIYFTLLYYKNKKKSVINEIVCIN